MMASLFGKLPIPKFLPQRGVELKTKDSNRDVRKQVSFVVEGCKGICKCCMFADLQGCGDAPDKTPNQNHLSWRQPRHHQNNHHTVRQGTQFISNRIIII